MRNLFGAVLLLVLISCGKGNGTNNNTNNANQANNVNKIVDNDVKSFATTSLLDGERSIFACNERIEDHGRKIINRKILYTYKVEEKRTWKKLWFGKAKKVHVFARLLKIDRSRYNSVYKIGTYEFDRDSVLDKNSFSLIKGENGFDAFDVKLDKGDKVEIRRMLLDDFSAVSLKFNRNCTDKI